MIIDDSHGTLHSFKSFISFLFIVQPESDAFQIYTRYFIRFHASIRTNQ